MLFDLVCLFVWSASGWSRGLVLKDAIHVRPAAERLSPCRRYASVPLAIGGYGRALNLPGDVSPGHITSVGRGQKGACTPYPPIARGKNSESPLSRGVNMNGLLKENRVSLCSGV